MTGRPAAEFADRRIAGTGTGERAWHGWPGWRTGTAAGLAELVPDGARLVVVAPHPDDETLGCGGLLHDAARAGREVRLVAVTAGGGSHPGSTRWPPAELVARRRAERAAALARLGLPGCPVHELDLPDGAVTRHRDELAGAVRALCRPGDVLVAPWRYDGHPDHEATAEAVLAAAPAGTVLQVPIWGWHWARPEAGQLPERPLLFAPAPDALRAKRRAVAEFTSQLSADPSTGAAPVLPSWALSRWLRGVEVFLP
ncbi:MAG TPA: PIG-L family deacetylase [Jatrophihabitans sp.]|nr:PIG-L family deacetylase [Jatrophihabitans sp.]